MLIFSNTLNLRMSNTLGFTGAPRHSLISWVPSLLLLSFFLFRSTLSTWSSAPSCSTGFTFRPLLGRGIYRNHHPDPPPQGEVPEIYSEGGVILFQKRKQASGFYWFLSDFIFIK